MQRMFLCLWLAALGTMFALSLVPHLITTSHNSDKYLHINAYCLLMTGAMILTQKWRFRFAFAVFLSILGVLIEYLQGIVGGRQVSAYDALANILGVVLGIIIGWLCDKGLHAHPKISLERRKE